MPDMNCGQFGMYCWGTAAASLDNKEHAFPTPAVQTLCIHLYNVFKVALYFKQN